MMRHDPSCGIADRWRAKVKRLKREVYALYLAYKDPRVPWYAKAFIACVVGYALSPVDLIPDFIPVLGYLDDIVLLPIGIWLALKMIPPAVLAECRQQALERLNTDRPQSVAATAVVIAVWILLLGLSVACIVWLV